MGEILEKLGLKNNIKVQSEFLPTAKTEIKFLKSTLASV